MFGAVERVAGILQGFAGVASREVGFGKGQPEVDGERSENASVRQENASFAFRDGLRIIAEVALELAGGVEAAELHFDVSRAVGEGAGLLKMPCGSHLRKEKATEEHVAATEKNRGVQMGAAAVARGAILATAIATYSPSCLGLAKVCRSIAVDEMKMRRTGHVAGTAVRSSPGGVLKPRPGRVEHI